MVLGKLPVPGRPTIWITVGQWPTALAVGADGGCLDIFTLIYPFSPLSPSLWETARYRLKYCLKGPLNQNQPTKSFACESSALSAGEGGKGTSATALDPADAPAGSSLTGAGERPTSMVGGP